MKKSIIDGAMELMEILEGAEMKPRVGKTAVVMAIAPKVEQETVYEYGAVIAQNGISVTTGNTKKKCGGAKGAKVDIGKAALKDIYEPAIKGHAVYKTGFEHSTEGLIVRLDEADYSIKVSKAKEKKYDVAAADFASEKDFSVRGKAKNSAPGIAKAILAALETSDMKFVLISAKGSGIILQMAQGEYTVKISKKRDRVGFEAEKGAAYDK